MSTSIDIDDFDICCICLDKIDVFTTLSCCKNKIHKNCILEILKNNGHCPLCRHEFSEENIEEILSDDSLIDELYNHTSSKETEESTPDNDVSDSFRILSCCVVSAILLVSTSSIMTLAILIHKHQ